MKLDIATAPTVLDPDADRIDPAVYAAEPTVDPQCPEDLDPIGTVEHLFVNGEPVTALEGTLIRSLEGWSRSWLDYDRQVAGQTKVLDCHFCEVGVAEVRNDGEEVYGVNGSLVDGTDVLCPACVQAEGEVVVAPVLLPVAA